MKLGRNDKCWCGSGKKYKKCHLYRESEQRASLWQADSALRESFQKETCLAPNSMKAGCSEKICRAHTVPKSGSLLKIARNGHVYSVIPSMAGLHKNEGAFVPQLLGVNRASTFTGFCTTHDNSIFAALEKDRFVATPEQCFLLGYRALSREVYNKIAHRRATEKARDLDRGRSPLEQRLIQDLLSAALEGVSAGIADNERHKAQFDERLINRRFDDTRAYSS